MSGETAEAETPETDETKVDLSAIVPVGTTLIVEGIECRVRRLKTREFLALSNVIVSGFGPGIINTNWSGPPEQISSNIVATLVLAVPNATEQFIAFVQTILEPVVAKDRTALSVALKNPEIDVLLDALEIMATQEADDIAGLMGKAKSVWNRLQTLYRPPTTSSNGSPRAGKPARGRARSTS